MVIPPPVRPPRITQFLKPYVLKMHFTNKYVSAQVTHSPSATVASAASSQEKALRPTMENTRDVAAAAKIGKILGERLLLKDIPAVTVFLKKDQKYHGKVKAVIDSLREVGVKIQCHGDEWKYYFKICSDWKKVYLQMEKSERKVTPRWKAKVFLPRIGKANSNCTMIKIIVTPTCIESSSVAYTCAMKMHYASLRSFAASEASECFRGKFSSVAFFTTRFFNKISNLVNVGTIDQFLRKLSDKFRSRLSIYGTMSFQHPVRNFSVGASLPSAPEKISDDPLTSKTPQSTVTCAYQAYVAGYWRNVMVLWCKNLMNHTLSLIISNLEGEVCYNCKIDLKPWLFWSKKGSKSFELEGCQVDIHWDFRSAKFAGSPEPASDYYVAVVSDEEVVLLLGDYNKKAYKKAKARPALVEAILYLKKEHVFHKKTFSTRAKFDEKKHEHDIIVESSTGGPRDPEMWISIDGIVMIHVRNLQWKFRGNQTVMLSRQPVQVFWDVHDWLFSTPGTGHGLFIFKPGVSESEDDKDGSSYGTPSDTSDGSMYFSTRSVSATPEFCLFLYAWKIE
ncbi:unnamed protein product [Dovyalis caffra]|uniref:Ribosomal protein L18e/L15P domain-containing protein n=1 Tax=Dovyalis caffra TaxID=77055 RepID=A0AAV1SQX1_9ROSI|nr:unnamed protein product [Dovyalis caffra]